MPVDTLNFAAQCAQECITLRYLVDENEKPADNLINAELAYCELIEDLSNHEVMLSAMPDLMTMDVIDHKNEQIGAVLSHLIIRCLQPDWTDNWLHKINTGELPTSVLQRTSYLPETIEHNLVKQALHKGGALTDWAMQYIVRNQYHSLAKNNLLQIDNLTLAAINFYGCYATNNSHYEHALLSTLLTANETNNITALTVQAALALMTQAHPAGLEYLRQPSVLEDESSGYGRWLACHGTEADLRLLEQRIAILLAKSEAERMLTSQSMLSIIGILNNLGQYGDAKTSLWIHKNILQINEPRLRFEGFRAMLTLFDKDMVVEGYQLLDQANEAQDDYGTYKYLDAHADYAYWGNLQKSMGNHQLLPPGRCRNGKALDQLNELNDAIHALTFGDNKTADFIRLTFALMSGQHCALDPYAPYERYCQQRDDFLAAIAQYRVDSQYISGSFKQA